MASFIDTVGLLERAISYAVGSVAAVNPQRLSYATPCAEWDLRTLLHHVNDSITVLHDGIDTGHVAPDAAPDGDLPADPIATFRDRAGRLLGAWTSAGRHDWTLAVGDLPLMASAVVVVGAIEIAVHGWDISRACGGRRQIPPALALDLLKISRRFVPEAARYPQFAAPVPVSPLADPSDRLIAYLGRRTAP